MNATMEIICFCLCIGNVVLNGYKSNWSAVCGWGFGAICECQILGWV